MWPPALLVKLGQLNALWKPDCQVIVQGSALLQFGNPHVAKRNVSALAPLANRFQTSGKVPRLPIIDASIGQRTKPYVFTETLRCCKAVEMSTCPDRAPEPAHASFLNYGWLKTDVQKRGVSCFRWDKPSGFAASRKAADARPSGSQRISSCRWVHDVTLSKSGERR